MAFETIYEEDDDGEICWLFCNEAEATRAVCQPPFGNYHPLKSTPDSEEPKSACFMIVPGFYEDLLDAPARSKPRTPEASPLHTSSIGWERPSYLPS